MLSFLIRNYIYIATSLLDNEDKCNINFENNLKNVKYIF